MNLFNHDKRQSLKSLAAIALSSSALTKAPTALAQEKKLQIGYWPISAGLPFFVACEKGFFKAAGIQVEAVKFASPNQVVEAMIAGRIDGCANGVAITALALADAQSPGSIKFTCVNFANEKYILDEIIVPINSSIKDVSELAGKRVACGPGINNVTLAKALLQGAGAKDAKVVELPITQILPALSAAQVDAAYILEPTGVIGTQQKISRPLAAGVISKYVLGDNLPWIGGAAALTSKSIKDKSALIPQYLSAYSKGVEFVRKEGLNANQYLAGYTAIEGELAKSVPLSGYIDYPEVKPTDMRALQKLFDIFTERKVFEHQVLALPLFYKKT
jgi:NitT/TauT family transport system substrate-binding protein